MNPGSRNSGTSLCLGTFHLFKLRVCLDQTPEFPDSYFAGCAWCCRLVFRLAPRSWACRPLFKVGRPRATWLACPTHVLCKRGPCRKYDSARLRSRVGSRLKRSLSGAEPACPRTCRKVGSLPCSAEARQAPWTRRAAWSGATARYSGIAHEVLCTRTNSCFSILGMMSGGEGKPQNRHTH